jgi:penicillin G amidase
MIPEHYPYQVGFEWEPPYRFERIRAVLENARRAQHKLTIADMQALQNVVVSLPALELQSLVRSTALRDDPALVPCLHWDGELARESTAVALYEVWLRQICRALGRRFSAEHSEHYRDLKPDKVMALLADPDRELFGEDPVGARDTLLLEALRAARSSSSVWDPRA